MFLLVSVARTRAALRLDDGEDDTLIAFYISAASRVILRYLKGQASSAITIIDSPAIDSPPDSPPDDLTNVDEAVAFAVIALVGILYKQPDGDEAKNFAATGELPKVVTALIYAMRDPALA